MVTGNKSDKLFLQIVYFITEIPLTFAPSGSGPTIGGSPVVAATDWMDLVTFKIPLAIINELA